ncbi:complement component 4 binding protein alpha [Chelydra serpentina]|uniref:Complement component 4 binding protein alpha n=1 Tax=Chelydra serpentina TaxID=8475 RepID=A0A8T1T1I5_CHESE|nr:complement component 4 binding protein alpha [Chelydra serpentina]
MTGLSGLEGTLVGRLVQSPILTLTTQVCGKNTVLIIFMLPVSFPLAITCSPPPNIANGMHDGSNKEIFDYNSSVTYKCHHNFSLTGEASIHCTTKDNITGVWNGPAPECTDEPINMVDLIIGIGAVAIIGIAVALNKKLRQKLFTALKLYI